MQVTNNYQMQNPKFGYSCISREAQELLKERCTTKQLNRLRELIVKENGNKVVQAYIGRTKNRLTSDISIVDNNNKVVDKKFKALPIQSVFLRLFGGDVVYIKRVFEKSKAMLEKYDALQKIQEMFDINPLKKG